MDCSVNNIKTLLSDRNPKFESPVYQRNYAWEANKECARLLSGLEKAAETKKDSFIGAIVLLPKQDNSSYIVVDGIQRITTMSLFLYALNRISAFAGFAEEAALSKVAIYLESDEKGLSRVALKEDDAVIFGKLFKARTDDRTAFERNLITDFNAEEKKSLIYKNFLFFYDHLKQLENNQEAIRGLFLATEKLLFAKIVLKNDANPQDIFDSLNSTGLGLTTADLVRNSLLLSTGGIDEQNEAYHEYWKPTESLFFESSKLPDFLRAYARIACAMRLKNADVVNDSNLGIAYDALIDSYNKNEGPLELLSDLASYAPYFNLVVNANSSKADNTNLLTGSIAISKVKEFTQRCQATLYPFLMEILREHHHSKLSKEEAEKTINLIITYELRRKVCSLKQGLNNPTAFVDMVFTKLAEHSSIYEATKAALLAIKGRPYELVVDSEFEHFLMTEDLYNQKGNIIHYILCMIDRGTPNFLEVNLSLEHILPQGKSLRSAWKEALGENWSKIHDKYSKMLGNYTLCDKGINSTMKNAPFAQKKPFFEKSTFQTLNRDIIDKDVWTPQNIEMRSKHLAEEAIKRWPYPDFLKD